MKDSSKTEQALTEELASLRRRIGELEQSEVERKKIEEALRESEERFRSLFDRSLDCVFIHNFKGQFMDANPAALRLLGYKKEEIPFLNFAGLIGDDEIPKAMEMFAEVKQTGFQKELSEFKVRRKDGSHVYLETKSAVVYHVGKPFAILGIARDITARKRVEEELRRNQDVAERMAQEMAIIAEIGKVVASTLDTREVYERFVAETQKLILFDSITVNLYNCQKNTLCVAYVFGLDIDGRKQGDHLVLQGSLSEAVIRARTGLCIQPTSIDEIVGRFPRLTVIFQAGLRSILCVPLIYRDEVIGVLHFRSKKLSAYTEQDLRLAERIGEQIAGTIANAQLYADLVKTEQELKKSEQRYRELSIIDDLTQLYNSRHFYFQLKIELDRANRYGQPLTLLLLDLDDFKAFNDAYGHVEGDQVLWRLGRVIKRCLRRTDSAYRYGGEEFTIIMPMTTSAEGAVTAERIRMEFKKETFSPVPGPDVHMTVSIGLAKYNSQEEMKAFVHRVDQLMYQGKKNGKDRVCSESSPQKQFKG
ncbi:MAG: diguanylate cyclase [Pseudomonadota bacterium]